jgi:hypothetical protein
VATIKDPNPLATTVKSSKSNSSEKLNNPVSATEFSLNAALGISPNPSTGSFTITNSSYVIREISIYNMLGESIFHKQLNSRKAEIVIPDIPDGIYQMHVITNAGAVSRKIVISR